MDEHKTSSTSRIIDQIERLLQQGTAEQIDLIWRFARALIRGGDSKEDEL